jgi:hypothetical protein
MPYCTNCGNDLKKQSKFCTHCGAKIESNKQTSGVKIDKTKTGKINNQNENESVFEMESKDFERDSSLKSKLLGFYVIFAITLHLLGQGSEQIIGLSIYSIVITVIVGSRFNKADTFNWVVKILLLLQFVFILSILIPQWQALFSNLVSSAATVLFGSMLLVIILMAIIGNREQKDKS